MTLTRAQQVDALLTRRDAVLTQLAEMAATSIGGMPNTNGTGDHLDHVGLRKSLYDELRQINDVLELLEGPAESHSRGRLT